MKWDMSVDWGIWKVKFLTLYVHLEGHFIALREIMEPVQDGHESSSYREDGMVEV